MISELREQGSAAAGELEGVELGGSYAASSDDTGAFVIERIVSAEGFHEILGLVPGAPYALDVVADGFLASESTPLSVGECGAEERVDRVLALRD